MRPRRSAMLLISWWCSTMRTSESVVQTRFATSGADLAESARRARSRAGIQQARAAVAAELDEELLDRPHYVFLGTWLGHGVAREAALKVQEAAAAWSESHPALEYRHGPLAAATEKSVVWMLGVADDALGRRQRTGATCRHGRQGRAGGARADSASSGSNGPVARAGSGPAAVSRARGGAGRPVTRYFTLRR